MNASTKAAIGSSHIAVLRVPNGTTAFVSVSGARVSEIVPSIATSLLQFGSMTGAWRWKALAPSGGLPSRLLKGLLS
jgi:hypothetical protein